MTDIFLRSGEANPSDVKLKDPTLADAINITGTGAPSSFKVTAVAAGKETFTGTGAVISLKATSAGVSKETFTGTGAATSLKATSSGSGKEIFTATGAVTSFKATTAAAGKETFTGTGSATSLKATASGAEKETFLGTGAAISRKVATAAPSILIFLGICTPASKKATAAGLGGIVIAGTGSVTSLKAQAAAVALERFTGLAPGILRKISAASAGSITSYEVVVVPVPDVIPGVRIRKSKVRRKRHLVVNSNGTGAALLPLAKARATGSITLPVFQPSRSFDLAGIVSRTLDAIALKLHLRKSRIVIRGGIKLTHVGLFGSGTVGFAGQSITGPSAIKVRAAGGINKHNIARKEDEELLLLDLW